MLHDERSREEVRRLENDFFDWFEAADAEELEDGTLDGFLEELERVDPLPGGFDPQKSLADFHEKYAALLEPQKEEKRQNHRSRRVFFAVAAVAAVLASMVTAQALGVDIFGFFGRWTDDIFTLTSSADKAGYQKRFYPMGEGESIKYSSLEEALRAFQIDMPLVPRWFPERFGEFEVTGSVMPYGMRIFACSTAEVEGHTEVLTVEYSEFGEDGPTFAIEKDQNDPILYESGGMIYHIVTDNGHCKAAWTIDNIQCVIAGPLTVEEMERIINSIYSDIDRKQMIELIYSGNGEDPALASGKEKLHYHSMEEALEEFQMDIAAPQWFPERFGELEVTGTVMPGHKSVYAWAETDQKDFVGISYAKDGEGVPGTVIEKDGNPPVLYESGGVQHYLLTDHEWRKAVWMQGDIECIIRGNIAEEEMKQIIDSIYSDGEKETESPPPSSFASSLQAALDECGIPGEFVPTWYPEGFEASEPEIISKKSVDIISVGFHDAEERFFAIRIAQYRSSEDLEALAFEKDKTPVEQYTSGGKTFYIFSNIDTITAVWTDGLVSETIMGNLTVEEVKKIIDSIYSDGEKEAEFPPPSSFASSLKAALDECGISGEFVPTWCPEGFEASEPVISNTSRTDKVYIMFRDGEERFFAIRIAQYRSSEDLEALVFEKDKTPVEQYTSGGKTFYIFSNIDTITAVWADGLVRETIMGNLTVEEVKKIIDSIDS